MFKGPIRQFFLVVIIIGAILIAIMSINALQIVFSLQEESRGLACNQLPNFIFANQTFNNHLDSVEDIENINPGNIWVELQNRDECPEKGEVVIFYDGINSKNKIIELIGNNFFGIPLRWRNI